MTRSERGKPNDPLAIARIAALFGHLRQQRGRFPGPLACASRAWEKRAWGK